MVRPLVDARDLARLLAGPEPPLVCDCRHRLDDPAFGERAHRDGHLPGALFVSVDRDLSAPPAMGADGHLGRHPLPDPDDWLRRLGALGVTPARQVVAYDDQSGAWAARLWWLLAAVGHEAVAVLDGGLAAWTATGSPLEPGPVAPRPAPPYPGRFRAEWTASLAEVRRAVAAGAGDLVLLDVREEARFRGVSEPIDPVAGHVPGAVSASWRSSLGPDGRFLAPAELRARFLGLLAGRPPAAAVAYCGSGVTACHTLLALEVAGLGGARLFPASWSGWCRTPGLPVATGG